MEAAAVQATVPAIGEVIKLSFCFVCSRGDYFAELEDNLGTLRNEVVRLLDLLEHVLSRIRRENGPRMQKRYQVEDWLNRVDVFQTETVQIIADAEEEIQEKCIRFFCPKNCCSCNRVGIRVTNKLENVKELLRDGNFTDVVESNPDAENNLVNTVTEFFLQSTQRVIRIFGLRATDEIQV
ncbi:hypothetical protein P3X46_010829 [Hevea brasiliensis]|uniref:Rx N-terminal domain-containing protein n=1 Tax=Hevea brasiliensis TaxID=3981 RepID=A0ABQ9MFA3_HEVBR|nr:hypothetical protein P3X46_010829 [Hevea brasiliensis]